MAAFPLGANSPVRFGVFELDPSVGELRKHGLRLKLQDQPLQVLQVLVEKSGQLVTREELQRRLWPSNTFVEFDKGIYNAIKRLREALSDDAETPRYIETIPRRGYRFIAPLTSAKGPSTEEITSSKSTQGTRRWLVWGAAMATVVLFAAGLLASNFFRLRDRVMGSSVPQIQSLAVLPLTNLSGDPAQEYFSDGMTDALITDLAQIGSLKVISRTSSMQYKQAKKTLPQIARALNVDGIVEGTLQRSGDRVRITAQLIHGPSDRHLWANTYERDARDVFILEREIAGDIARQIQTRLAAHEQAPIASTSLANLKALEAYLQGNFHLSRYAKGSGDEEKKQAAENFQQAIDADPNFAPAYVGLARAHWFLNWPSKQDAEIVRRATERSLALDPNSSDAHVFLADMKERAWEFSRAEEEYRRAIALNPSNAQAHDQLGWVLDEFGRWDEGWREQQIAQALDPAGDYLAGALDNRRQIDRAIAMRDLLVKRFPDDGYLHVALFWDYLNRGMYAEAQAHEERLWTLFGFPQVTRQVYRAFLASGYKASLRASAKEMEHLMATNQFYLPVNLADFYAALGDKDRAFYWLEQSYVQHDIGMFSTDIGLDRLNTEAVFDPLRSDPRFKNLLHRVGLPELQLTDLEANNTQNSHN